MFVAFNRASAFFRPHPSLGVFEDQLPCRRLNHRPSVVRWYNLALTLSAQSQHSPENDQYDRLVAWERLPTPRPNFLLLGNDTLPETNNCKARFRRSSSFETLGRIRGPLIKPINSACWLIDNSLIGCQSIAAFQIHE